MINPTSIHQLFLILENTFEGNIHYQTLDKKDNSMIDGQEDKGLLHRTFTAEHCQFLATLL